MNKKGFLSIVGSAFDPRRDIEKEIPRPFLFAKNAVEYLFKLVGFFLLICLTVGLVLAACTQNAFLQLLPLLLATSFFFYIAITTLGIPVFLIIAEINNVIIRRLIAYATVLLMLLATFYSVYDSPVFEILLTYVGKLFPAAFECKDGILELDG